jgi:hypothetical protein
VSYHRAPVQSLSEKAAYVSKPFERSFDYFDDDEAQEAMNLRVTYRRFLQAKTPRPDILPLTSCPSATTKKKLEQMRAEYLKYDLNQVYNHILFEPEFDGR